MGKVSNACRQAGCEADLHRMLQESWSLGWEHGQEDAKSGLAMTGRTPRARKEREQKRTGQMRQDLANLLVKLAPNERVAVLEEGQRVMKAEIAGLLAQITGDLLAEISKNVGGTSGIESRNEATARLVALVGKEKFVELLKKHVGAGTGPASPGLSSVGDGSAFLRSVRKPGEDL